MLGSNEGELTGQWRKLRDYSFTRGHYTARGSQGLRISEHGAWQK